MGTLLSLSKSWTIAWLALSEWALLVFGIALLLGLVGEYFDLKPSLRATRLKHSAKFLVILGVVGEIFSDGGIFVFSNHLQTISDRENAVISLQVAGLNKEAADERLKADKLEVQMTQTSTNVAKLQPRKLNDSHRYALANFLRLRDHVNGDHVFILYTSGDIEAEIFAEDLTTAFVFAQLKVDGPIPINWLVSGVKIGVQFISRPPPPLALKISAGFKSIGLDSFIGLSPMNMNTNDVAVIVGRKPDDFVGFSTNSYMQLLFDDRGVGYESAGDFVENGKLHISNPIDSKVHVEVKLKQPTSLPPMLYLMTRLYAEYPKDFSSAAIGEQIDDLSWKFDSSLPAGVTNLEPFGFRLEIAP